MNLTLMSDPFSLLQESQVRLGSLSSNYYYVSYTMIYTPCFEEVYLNIGNQSGCFCETSFLKAGLYCSSLLQQTSTIGQDKNQVLLHIVTPGPWPKTTKATFSRTNQTVNER